MTCSMMQHIKIILGNKIILSVAILYSIAITILFFIPTDGLPSVGGSGIDKVVHILFFFSLVILWQLVVFKYKGDVLSRRIIFWILGLALAYGILVEVIQGELTASRTADPYDVIADLAGAFLGVWAFSKMKTLFKT